MLRRVSKVSVGCVTVCVALSVAGLLACDEEKAAKPDPEPPTSTTTAAPTAPKTATAPAAGQTPSTSPPTSVAIDAAVKVQQSTPSFDRATKCKERCLLLTEFSLSDLVGKKAGCKACENTPEACYEGVTWFEDECALVEGQASDDYMRNCIYAAHGYTFKKKTWRQMFAKKSWYSARADFAESELSSLETRNIRALRARAKQCKKKGQGPVASKHKSAVFAFIKKAKAGKAKLPKQAFAEMEPSTAKQAKAMFRDFRWNSSATIAYVLYGPDGEKPKKGHRVLEVFEVDAPKDCDDDHDSCEGDEYLIVELSKKNKVVSIGFRGTSACPFVYVEGPSGGTGRPRESFFAGEILRTLPSAAAEATQHLRLGSSVSCDPVVTIRIAEEKLERTFLDSASLVVGDEELTPTQCANPRAFCHDDGDYEVMDQGQSVELRFEIPQALRCQPAKLRANGYYLPL